MGNYASGLDYQKGMPGLSKFLATNLFIHGQGDTIETDSAKERKFSRKIVPGDPNRKWNT
jgi:hypothetical protein